MGIAKQNIANGEFGYVAHFGKLEDVDTKSQAVNSFVWFDSAGSTAGNWTTTQPTAPNAKILLAVIIKAESSSNANNGVILVRPTIEPKISELQDVNLSSLTNGDVLIYDETLDSGGNSINRWKNSSLLSKHELDIVNIFNGTNVLTETPTPVGRSVADQYGNEIFSVYLSKDGANDLYFTKSFLNENFVTYVGGSSFFVSISQRGQPNGIASLGGDGRVPPSQLPASIGEILEFETFEEFPFEGTAERIYIAKDTNITYRWSGTQYVEISQSLALGETSESAYRGDRGKIAYDHSQIVTGNPHGTNATDVGAEPANANIQAHISSTSNPHGVTVGQIGAEPANANIQAHVTLTNGSNPHQTTFANIATKPTTLSGYGITDALTSTQISSTYIPLTQKGAVSGVATLDSNSKIPVAQLPNSVFDSLFYFESMNVTNVNSSSEKREIIVDRLLDGLKVANFDRNRGIAGFYFVISGGGTIADVTGLRADNLDNDHPYEDSYATLRFKVQDGSTGATGTGPNTGFSTSSGVLEIGDWFIIESVTGLGTEASPFIFTVAVVNNTYEVATTTLHGITRLSSRTTYADLGGNNVITESVLKTTVDNAGFAVASNYLPLTGGNITGNLNVSGNIGVGTTSPAERLDVNGWVRTANGTFNGGGLLIPSNANSASREWGIRTENAALGDFAILQSTAQNTSAKDGTTRFYINPSGNVGIGTTSPGQRLEINGNTGQPATSGTTQNGLLRLRPGTGSNDYGESLDLGFHVGVSGPASYGWIQSTNRDGLNTNYSLALNPNGGNVGIGTASPATLLHLNSNTNTIQTIETTSTGANFANLTLKTGSKAYTLGSAANGVTFQSLANKFFIFDESAVTTRLVIDTTGNVGIGTTSPGYTLDVNGSVAGNSAYVNKSDARLKQNIETITNGLDMVMKLRPVQYKWKKHPTLNFDLETTELGFTAQEVQQALTGTDYVDSVVQSTDVVIEPAKYEEIIKEDGTKEQKLISEEVKQKYFNLAESKLVAILTKAIQELAKRVEELESK
jgi:hypothetical protein